MDVRGTYRKIRQVESSIQDEFVVIFSLPTVDGGREGVLTQVARYSAAKSIVEGRARLATPEECARYHEKVAAARRTSEESVGGKVQISVLSEQDVKAIRAALKPVSKS